MNSSATLPLVSVVVRTLWRQTLPRALASIAAQTYRPLEIVLVDAAGSGRSIARQADIPVRMVHRGRLARPRAANAGLEAASGSWIVMLDEDDEFLPTHVAQLVATAMVSGAPVAYSQTRLVDARGNTLRVFGGPFNRAALLRSNYLHMSAVLFSRAFVDEGVRFDESLTVFEDWDLWLQLCARTEFAFSGQATAVYHAAEGQSGAGSGSNLDREVVLAQRERLLAKWGPSTRSFSR